MLLQRRIVSPWPRAFTTARVRVVADLDRERLEPPGDLQARYGRGRECRPGGPSARRAKAGKAQPGFQPPSRSQFSALRKPANGIQQKRDRRVGHLVIEHVGRMGHDDARATAFSASTPSQPTPKAGDRSAEWASVPMRPAIVQEQPDTATPFIPSSEHPPRACRRGSARGAPGPPFETLTPVLGRRVRRTYPTMRTSALA